MAKKVSPLWTLKEKGPQRRTQVAARPPAFWEREKGREGLGEERKINWLSRHPTPGIFTQSEQRSRPLEKSKRESEEKRGKRKKERERRRG